MVRVAGYEVDRRHVIPRSHLGDLLTWMDSAQLNGETVLIKMNQIKFNVYHINLLYTLYICSGSL